MAAEAKFCLLGPFPGGLPAGPHLPEVRPGRQRVADDPSYPADHGERASQIAERVARLDQVVADLPGRVFPNNGAVVEGRLR